MGQWQLNDLIQGALLVFSGASIYFLSRKNGRNSLIGLVLTLISEPFWYYTAYLNKQWGIFLLSIWFTICAIQGIWFRRDAFRDNTIQQRSK